MMPRERLIRIMVALTEDQHEWLRRRAFDDRVSIAELIRRAVEEIRAKQDLQQALPL